MSKAANGGVDGNAEPLTASQYPFLHELGIEEDNPGCFCGGKFFGSGDLLTSIVAALGSD